MINDSKYNYYLVSIHTITILQSVAHPQRIVDQISEIIEKITWYAEEIFKIVINVFSLSIFSQYYIEIIFSSNILMNNHIWLSPKWELYLDH